MARQARKASETGIYHIMLRGADGRILFADDEDCNRFLECVRQIRERSHFYLYAYCLMGNHVHLLLQQDEASLETIFKGIGIRYVHYYNWKYQLHGHLFQDRFKSEPVNDDAYFLDALRYIYQNPVKAGLCVAPEGYHWSSYRLLGYASPDLDDARILKQLPLPQLKEFVGQSSTQPHLEDGPSARLTDREAIGIIKRVCRVETVQELLYLEKSRRVEMIVLAYHNGVSIRQLSRLTGISKSVISRAVQK